jgi:hypothetical protein
MTFKTEREIMKIADHIEALAFKMVAPNAYTPMFVSLANEIRTAIHTRLAQPEQEPVAWQVMVENEATNQFSKKDMAHDWSVQQKLSGSPYAYWIRPLYTAPPEQESLAWLYPEGLAALKAGKCWTAYGTQQDKDNSIPIYTAPPEQERREWQGLTDEELIETLKSIVAPWGLARAIEAKLKEKNT